MGQKRRAALARLLASRARLWLLDEPLTSLDAEGVELVSELLKAHLKQEASRSWPPTSLYRVSHPVTHPGTGGGRMKAIRALMQRDIRLAFRRRGELLTPAMFFILVTALFPLGSHPRPDLLQTIAPAWCGWRRYWRACWGRRASSRAITTMAPWNNWPSHRFLWKCRHSHGSSPTGSPRACPW